MAWFEKARWLCILFLGIRPADTFSACTEKVATMAAQVQMGNPDFLKLSLASGKSIPYDAGKYVMCTDLKDTRYFLVLGVALLPASVGGNLGLKIGFCVPNVCDHDGVKDLLINRTVGANYLPELALVKVINITSTSPDLDLVSEDAVGVVCAIFMICICSLVVVSTVIVLVSEHARAAQAKRLEEREQNRVQNTSIVSGTSSEGGNLLSEPMAPPREPPAVRGLAANKFIKAFSMFGPTGTWTKLFEIPPYKPTDSLNGMRVINMAWIIMGHTFLMPEGISGYSNPQDITVNPLNTQVAEKNPLFQIVLGAQAGVDTFFFLSGFLLSHLTLKELRSGRMNVVLAIILRYVRLTPSLALVMLVFYKIWVFFGHGPFAVTFQDSINRRCDGSWWSELTYTMNFIPFDSDKVCMGWTWYLGDDMIFFIIAMFLLPVYYKSRVGGWVVCIVLTILSFGITTYLVLKHHLSIYVFDDTYKQYSYWAYSKPYTRIPAYFVGIAFAWLLDDLEKKGIDRQTRPDSAFARTTARLGAFISILLIVFIVVLPYTDFGDSRDDWNDLASVLYINFARPVFAACWAVLALLCYYDYLPFINSVLSHPYWTPFARLTYGAYLTHPLVIKLAAARAYQFYTFSGLAISYRFIGNVLLAHMGSFGLWVLCERPCMTIFSPAKKKKDPGAPSRETSLRAVNPSYPG